MRDKKVVGILVAILVVVVGAAGIYWYIHRAPTYGVGNNSPEAVLERTNQEFNSANAFRDSGDYAQALAAYQAALPEAQDLTQQGQIAYDIGLMNEFLGNYTTAITDYKQIAANPDYYAVVRAFSVQEMGTMYHTYYAAHQAIANATFTGTPYASFLADENLTAAYQKLFEYAAEIYPLAVAESFVANGYSADLTVNASTTPQGKIDVAGANSAMAAAAADIPRTTESPTEVGLLPDIYLREAIVVSQMTTAGVPGYTYARSEALYQNALTDAIPSGMLPGNFIDYHYAVFLALHSKPVRTADIEKILSVFTASNAKNIQPTVPAFFLDVLTDPTETSDLSYVRNLARLDPSFKTYLLSIGWHESDFTNS